MSADGMDSEFSILVCDGGAPAAVCRSASYMMDCIFELVFMIFKWCSLLLCLSFLFRGARLRHKHCLDF